MFYVESLLVTFPQDKHTQRNPALILLMFVIGQFNLTFYVQVNIETKFGPSPHQPPPFFVCICAMCFEIEIKLHGFCLRLLHWYFLSGSFLFKKTCNSIKCI